MKPRELSYWSCPYPRDREHADAIRRALRGETASATAGTFANDGAKAITMEDVRESVAALKARGLAPAFFGVDYGWDHAEIETKEK